MKFMRIFFWLYFHAIYLLVLEERWDDDFVILGIVVNKRYEG